MYGGYLKHIFIKLKGAQHLIYDKSRHIIGMEGSTVSAFLCREHKITLQRVTNVSYHNLLVTVKCHITRQDVVFNK